MCAKYVRNLKRKPILFCEIALTSNLKIEENAQRMSCDIDIQIRMDSW